MLHGKREPCSYRSIVIVWIVGCPIRGEIGFVSTVGVVVCLMSSAVRIHLIGVIIKICSICTIVRIVLISPVVELLFCMRFTGYLSHIFLLSELKKTTHFALCVVTII